MSEQKGEKRKAEADPEDEEIKKKKAEEDVISPESGQWV